MDIQSPPLLSSQYYDRNGQVSGDSDTAQLVGQQSVSASYTVPAGRRAIVASVTCGAFRLATATSDSGNNVTITVVPNGGGSQIIYSTRIFGNSVGSGFNVSSGFQLLLDAGDTITVNFSALSTDGTIQAAPAIGVNEFDAL